VEASPVEAPARATGGSETVLVAEDEPMLLDLVTRVLTHAGYRVLGARDGEEALALFDAHATEIDLALLDVMMPRIGGREVMDQILPTHPHVRFLFSSGYSEGGIHTDFVVQEGLRLISKPYRMAELLQAVRSVLDDAGGV